jgi:hypothetical protein
MHDVFISYSKFDKDIAFEICNYLENNGVGCWIAPRDVRPGSNYGAEIIRAIKTCKTFILVFSDNSNNSNHVANEIDNAFNNNKDIIPFKIEDFRISETFEYYLSKTHWIVIENSVTDYLPVLLSRCKESSVFQKSQTSNTESCSLHTDVTEVDNSEIPEKVIIRIKKLYEKTLFYNATDPEIAVIQAQKAGEAICKSIYLKYGLNKHGTDLNKINLKEISDLLFNYKIIPDTIMLNISTINDYSKLRMNGSVEILENVSEDYIKPCLLALGSLFSYYIENYYCEESETVNLGLYSIQKNLDDSEKTGLEEMPIIVIGNHAPPERIFEEEIETGFYFDIIRAIGIDQGMKFQFKQASFDMSFKILKAGKAQLMIGPNMTDERKKSFIYSEIAMPIVEKVFYVNPFSNPIIELSDLYTRLLITMKNTNYSPIISNDSRLLKVEVTNYDTGIEMVKNNGKYVIIMPETQGDFLLEEKNIDLVKSPYTISGESSYIIYNKNLDTKIIRKIEKGLENIISKNIYDEILAMY